MESMAWIRDRITPERTAIVRELSEAANDLHTGKRGAWSSREGTRRGVGKPRKVAECRLWEHIDVCFATEGGGIAEFGDDAMAMAIVGDGED